MSNCEENKMKNTEKNNYENSINILASQGKFRISLGLERISQILNLLGNPQDKIKIIHVAGTNGKGSVCASVESILREAGYRTGLYTSPHLIEYTERIKINGEDISKEDFAELFDEIFQICEKNNIQSTEFEILTAMAFAWFEKKCVDFAIIETGLGGRFDATNVIKKPVCSIITAIDLDHVDRLGTTIDEIAFEKAGIIKENSTVIALETNKGSGIINKVSKEKNSKLFTVKDEYSLKEDFSYSNGFNAYDLALKGDFQSQNLALILELMRYLNSKNFKITDISIEKGLKSVKWPARFEYHKEKNLIIDGAHNLQAAIALRKALDTYFKDKKVVWLYSSITTKDYKNIIDTLFKPEDTVIFTEFDSQSSIKTSDLPEKINTKSLYTFTNVADAVEALQKHSTSDHIRVIAGSFYMIGEAYRYLDKL